MNVQLWVEYILRFSHLVAGIAWIGSSFYFIWLDSSFEAPAVPRRNVEGELFMVHGGFYYLVEKRKLYPGELPKTLHWFKWEATLTWITGLFLLIALYYLRGASLMIDTQVGNISQLQAVGLSLGGIAVSWLIYDLIWNVRIVSSRAVSTILSVIFFTGLIYLNTRLFSGRGAFIQTGAVFGTIMLLNVWIRILPGQKKMFKAAEAGQIPDYSASLKSKIRSVHNTYFTFPVLFIMLSNHFPVVFNHPLNWLLLILLSVSGALVRHAMVTKINRQRWTLLPAACGLAALMIMTAPKVMDDSGHPPVPFAQVHAIIESRCITCHSAAPTDDVFKVPPKDLILQSEEQIRAAGSRIYVQAIVSQAMPLGNKTQMTTDERATLARWLRQEGYQTP